MGRGPKKLCGALPNPSKTHLRDEREKEKKQCKRVRLPEMTEIDLKQNEHSGVEIGTHAEHPSLSPGEVHVYTQMCMNTCWSSRLTT